MTLNQRRFSSIVFSVVMIISLPFFALGQIMVTPAQTAQALAQRLAGNGVAITNATLTCANNANGNFTANNFPLDSGIVLTTGLSATQGSFYGVNGAQNFLASFNNGTAGDAALNTLSGQNTKDACTLEFDVVPKGDSLKFQYVFSSEEYINATCGQYNDAFAFFISGPGIPGQQNMALVPGTNIPVTINSINSGIPGPGHNIANCLAMGPGSPFTGYFVDNSNSAVMTHKGMTTVLEASHDVIPCSTYHLKMVIADAGNYLYDSGVFIKAGSLQTASFGVTSLAGISPKGNKFVVKGCSPGVLQFTNHKRKPYPQVLKLVIAGTAVNGYDFATLPDSVVVPANDTMATLQVLGLLTPPNGVRTLKVYLKSPYACNSGVVIDSAVIDIYDSLHLAINTPDTSICFGATIPLNVSGDTIMKYTWTPAIGLSDATVRQPFATPIISTTYMLQAIVPGSGCGVKQAAINIKVQPIPIITNATSINQCNLLPLNLAVQVSPPYPNYIYDWQGPNGFQSNLASPTIATAGKNNAGVYTVKVKADTSNCYSTSSINVTITAPDTPIVRNPYIICQEDKQIPLEALGQNLLWYTAINGIGLPDAPVINAATIAQYQYFVSETVGKCESNRIPVQVQVKKCCDGLIIIPSGFTPNNDGQNDVFRVVADYGYSVIQFNIFNRWGQQVFSVSNNIPWDGTYKGEPADPGAYFYEILVGCVNGVTVQKKGEVLLIR